MNCLTGKQDVPWECDSFAFALGNRTNIPLGDAYSDEENAEDAVQQTLWLGRKDSMGMGEAMLRYTVG